MRITYLRIRNFKGIRDMEIREIERALILVGKNNTGKTAVLDALRALSGIYRVQEEDFQEQYPNIEITVSLRISGEDLSRLFNAGRVSSLRNREKWEEQFRKRIPSFADGEVTWTYIVNRKLEERFSDGVHKNNAYLRELRPKVYYIDSGRSLEKLQSDVLLMQEGSLVRKMRSGCCLFDQAKKCRHCFSCIGLINKKTPEELDAFETARLLDYKLYRLNLDTISKRLNEIYHENGGSDTILYSMNRDIESMLSVTAEVKHGIREHIRPIDTMGKGMRSIYMLSLLEMAAEDDAGEESVILVEEPELYLHPQLQKTSGDILYRLSRSHQVIFSTHSPNLLPDFNSREIRQIVLDENGFAVARDRTDISVILDSLGYSAADTMNVDFIFLVEGKQDRTRLPILLKKYYSEIYDEKGQLSRTAIITTNSCTNIKTYANLKYMNQVYIRDNFLMIRDGDGKEPAALRRQLCSYYDDRRREEGDDTALPRVTEKNVLVLRYYSFENYFMNPEIMAKVGVLEKPEDFYRIFLEKWREYLSKISSGRSLLQILGHDLTSEEDVKDHMDDIRIILRGHNLFDLFYGRFKKRENEILTQYVELAPREEFSDILDAIDRFIYFANRKKEAAAVNGTGG